MKINFIKYNGQLVPKGEEDREKIDSFKDGAVYQVDIKNMDIRSLNQNKATHLWCKQIAETLNREKFFIQDVIKMNTKWDMLKVKEMIFKPVVKSLYTKDSTTKLNKDEFELIIDTITRYMAHKGVSIPDFPNRNRLDEITINKDKLK